MNIGPEYSAFVSTIQKNWKDETTNLAEAVLQIIRYFKFTEGTKKGKSILQISTFKSILAAPKRSYKNLECIKKDLITHYTNRS